MSLSRIAYRHRALLIGVGAIGLVIAGITAGAVVLLSGAYSIAATKQHFRITYAVLELGLRYSVATYADRIAVPDLERVADISTGHACYRKYCLQCHGAPGIARDPLGQGQLPAPSSLSQSAREWTAAQLFYVTQKGVRMSGMPAWEFRISDEGLWSTVAFLKTMPFMTTSEYQQMAASSANAACPAPTKSDPYSTQRAQVTLRQYACDSCHMIKGMVGARTHVGPSLEDWPRRKYIAGVLPNTRANLVRWIVDPQAISPHTMMPNLGVSEIHAQHMARYLLNDHE